MQNFKNRQNSPIFFQNFERRNRTKPLNTLFPKRLLFYVENTQSHGIGWKFSIAILK